MKRKGAGVAMHDSLPDADAFAEPMHKSGVRKDSAVVVASLGDGIKPVSEGPRLYWTLK